MPTYEYACRDCGRNLEIVQSFTDDPLETCEHCGGRLRKVFSAAGIIFKGSGYYVTDTRSEKGRAKTSSASDSSDSSDGESSGSKTSSGSKDASSGAKDTSTNGTPSSTSDTAGSPSTTGSSSSDAKSA